MMKGIGSVVAMLTICFVAVQRCVAQEQSVSPAQLDSRIGPAVASRYKPIRDAKKWKNPFLVIRRDGIEVSASTLASDRESVAVADLQQVLVDLSVAAWPYGRVVAVQDGGIRSPVGSDDAKIAENRKATLAVLATLHVTIEPWPSVHPAAQAALWDTIRPGTTTQAELTSRFGAPNEVTATFPWSEWAAVWKKRPVAASYILRYIRSSSSSLLLEGRLATQTQ